MIARDLPQGHRREGGVIDSEATAHSLLIQLPLTLNKAELAVRDSFSTDLPENCVAPMALSAARWPKDHTSCQAKGPPWLASNFLFFPWLPKFQRLAETRSKPTCFYWWPCRKFPRSFQTQPQRCGTPSKTLPFLTPFLVGRVSLLK